MLRILDGNGWIYVMKMMYINCYGAERYNEHMVGMHNRNPTLEHQSLPVVCCLLQASKQASKHVIMSYSTNNNHSLQPKAHSFIHHQRDS